jgi:septum formation protein
VPTAAAPLVCLASVSPRRRELLNQLGVPHTVSAADIDETVRPGEPAADYVLRMACVKARAVRLRDPRLPVLAADTTVVVDGLICLKPRDRADGIAMLRLLSGRTHQVLTAVALATAAGVSFRLSASEVRLRVVTAAECAAYWETGEPHDKAGGYAIQGRGALFIEHLSGSYSGVMGLPLFETGELLIASGVACLPVVEAAVPARGGRA